MNIHHHRHVRRSLAASGLGLIAAVVLVVLIGPLEVLAGSPVCNNGACDLLDTTVQDFGTGQFYLSGLHSQGDGEVRLLPIGVSGAWVTDTYHLPAARAELSVVSYQGILYAIGGFDSSGAVRSEINAATTTFGGPIASPGWQLADTMPSARASAAAVISPTQNGGFLYVLGGTTDGNPSYTTTIVYKAINSSGALIGAWQTATLPPDQSSAAPLVYLQTVVHGGYLYVLGGQDNSWSPPLIVDSIFRAPIAANGSLGAWVPEVSIPADGGQAGRMAFAAVVGSSAGDTDYLYVIGGQAPSSNGNVDVAFIDSAPFNEDGSLGAFSSQQPLSTLLHGLSGVQQGGQILMTGGNQAADGSKPSNNTETALITATSGVLNGGAQWTAASSLPQARFYHGSAVNSGGNIYVVGGDAAGSAATNTVYENSFGGSGASYAQAGSYTSRIIDFGGSYPVRALRWNTDITGGTETMTMQYRAAATAGALLSQPWLTTTNSAVGVGVTTTFFFSGVTANVFQYQVLLTTTDQTQSPSLNAVDLHYGTSTTAVTLAGISARPVDDRANLATIALSGMGLAALGGLSFMRRSGRR